MCTVTKNIMLQFSPINCLRNLLKYLYVDNNIIFQILISHQYACLCVVDVTVISFSYVYINHSLSLLLKLSTFDLLYCTVGFFFFHFLVHICNQAPCHSTGYGDAAKSQQLYYNIADNTTEHCNSSHPKSTTATKCTSKCTGTCTDACKHVAEYCSECHRASIGRIGSTTCAIPTGNIDGVL